MTPKSDIIITVRIEETPSLFCLLQVYIHIVSGVYCQKIRAEIRLRVYIGIDFRT